LLIISLNVGFSDFVIVSQISKVIGKCPEIILIPELNFK